MDQSLKSEQEAYKALLLHHFRGMIKRLRLLTDNQWDWTPDPAGPTARTLAVHAWQWLQCDRSHIAEPDSSFHPLVQEPPASTAALCDLMEEEATAWEELLTNITDNQLAAPRLQFNETEWQLNVRWFIMHSIQNTIYKHGQFSTLFYCLHHDGTEPYSAPFPNPIYAEINEGSPSEN